MKEAGDVHPASLTRPKPLLSRLQPYYDAYRYLSRARTWSQVGPNALTVTEIKSYLDIIEVDHPQHKLKYLGVIQDLDEVGLEYLRSKMKK